LVLRSRKGEEGERGKKGKLPNCREIAGSTECRVNQGKRAQRDRGCSKTQGEGVFGAKTVGLATAGEHSIPQRIRESEEGDWNKEGARRTSNLKGLNAFILSV